MSNHKPYNMGKSLHKKPDNQRTLIGVLIGFNAFLLLAVLGLMVIILINKNGAEDKETVSSVYEKSTAKTVSTSSLVQSAEGPANNTTVVTSIVDIVYENNDAKENEETLELACELLEDGDFQKAIYKLNAIKDESIKGPYLVHAKACSGVRGQLLMLDIEAADAAFNYVSEDLPGADVIRHEYECIKEAKAAIDSGDYVSAVEIYEELGGSYAGLAMDTYKNAADYYISIYEYEKAGPLLSKVINDSKYLSLHYYEVVVEEDENSNGGYSIGKEVFKKVRQYWDGNSSVFGLCYHDLNKEPGGFYYRFTSGGKYVFCEYDMTGTYKGRTGNY